MITIQAGYAVVVDDEPANRDFLERLLQMAGFKVSSAGTGKDGLAAARAVPSLALALIDQELPDGHGIDVIAQMRAENPESVLIMATMHDDRDLIDRAFVAGIDVFLVKPHGFMELYKRLQEVDSDASLLRRMVIDQYGPRPYRGPRRTVGTAAVAPVSTNLSTDGTAPTVPPVNMPAPVVIPAVPAMPEAPALKVEVSATPAPVTPPAHTPAPVVAPVTPAVPEAPALKVEASAAPAPVTPPTHTPAPVVAPVTPAVPEAPALKVEASATPAKTDAPPSTPAGISNKAPTETT
ncbi:MAG: response regulator [Anaerolinea sp.]|nr:response regulator [Anaerolinea sp.]